MKFNENDIIGNIVSQNYQYADVFSKHKIDFCCQGNRSILNACNTNGIDSKLIISDLENVEIPTTNEKIDFTSWPIDLLTDYIEKKHHRYVKEQIPVIQKYLQKIVSVHADKHPELIEIKKLFDASAQELISHMQKEELILFPHFKNLINKDNNQAGNFTSCNPIEKMMQEHLIEGERFSKINSLTNNYTVPQDGCSTYEVSFKLLQEFENDLHLHIHIENNILFPKALAVQTI